MVAFRAVYFLAEFAGVTAGFALSGMTTTCSVDFLIWFARLTLDTSHFLVRASCAVMAAT